MLETVSKISKINLFLFSIKLLQQERMTTLKA